MARGLNVEAAGRSTRPEKRGDLNAADLINKEHRLIARVLDALEVYVAGLESAGDAADRHDLARFVTFFREFADLGHHEKEENVLFPELVRAGYSWDDGLLSRIRKEHNQERYLMRTLRHASLQKNLWSTEDLRHLVSLARTFIEFQRAHIATEDKEILPVVRELPDNVQHQLSERLERFGDAWADGGEDAWLRGLAQDLVERYAPGHAAPDDTSKPAK